MRLAFLQLLKVQSEYTEMTYDPDPSNAPPSAPLPLNPHTAPSVASDSAAQSQLNTHRQTFTPPTDDWNEPVMSRGLFKVESVVTETEIKSEETPLSTLTLTDASESACALDMTLTGKCPDRMDPVRSHGALKVESVVMETKTEVLLSESVLTQRLIESPGLGAISQNLAPSPVTSDLLSPDFIPPLPVPTTGSCQNTQRTSRHCPGSACSQNGASAVAEPQPAVSTAALISLILTRCSNTAL